MSVKKAEKRQKGLHWALDPNNNAITIIKSARRAALRHTEEVNDSLEVTLQLTQAFLSVGANTFEKTVAASQLSSPFKK